MTMYCVFSVYFINYGIMYVVCPSTWAFVFIGSNKLYGIFPDLNAFWFNDIGYLITSSMLIEAIFPVIEFLLWWTVNWLKKAIDQRKLCCPNNKYKTHTKTLPAFEELYSGPEFEIHYKYAYLIDVVYLTCLYGPGMPIFFIYAVFAIFL